MSDILTPEQRRRLNLFTAPERTARVDAKKRIVGLGCLVLMALLVALLAAFTIGAWRWAIR